MHRARAAPGLTVLQLDTISVLHRMSAIILTTAAWMSRSTDGMTRGEYHTDLVASIVLLP